MLFKEEHRLMILKGEKTETRRPTWTPGTKSKPSREKTARPAVPGGTRHFYTRPAFANPPGLPFCKALILGCEREPLRAITEMGAILEGYSCVTSYMDVWERIWGDGSWARDCNREVFVVRFKVTEQLLCARCWQPAGPQGSFWSYNRQPERYCSSCPANS